MNIISLFKEVYILISKKIILYFYWINFINICVRYNIKGYSIVFWYFKFLFFDVIRCFKFLFIRIVLIVL